MSQLSPSTYGLHLTHDSLPKGISVGSAVFAEMTANCPYTLQWDVPSPSKLPLPMGGCGSLDPPESSTQTASRSVHQFLQGSLVWQTDRQTDHETRSVTIGRIYTRSTVMRPKKCKVTYNQFQLTSSLSRNKSVASSPRWSINNFKAKAKTRSETLGYITNNMLFTVCPGEKTPTTFLPHTAFSALTLLVGRQEGNPACKNWVVR